MEINFQVISKERMTLAFLYGIDEAETLSKLNNFLALKNITDSKYYFLDFVVSQGGKRNITYIKYATVPENTEGNKEINIVKIDEKQYLSFRLNEMQYLGFSDGSHRQAMETFLKTNNLKQDMSKIFALVEKINIDGEVFYDILFPLK